jgi:hypothetical protein
MYIGDSPYINCISGAMISMQKIMESILGCVKPKTIRLVFDTSSSLRSKSKDRLAQSKNKVSEKNVSTCGF